MRIVSDDKKSFVDITIRAAYNLPLQSGEDDDNWNTDVSIEVHTEWVTAKLNDVTLYRIFIDRFLASLKELEIRRKGIAKLEGAGYENFDLSIYNTDERGHIGMGVYMEKYDFRSERHALKATASFDIEPGDLPTLLSGFEKMFSKQNLAREFGKPS